MSTIRPYQDNETRRQYRNQTETQKKQLSETKEALVVNNLIKEPVNLTSMYDSLVIPETTDSFRYTTKSPADKKSEKSAKKSLISLLGITTGVFGVLAGGMALVSMAAKHKTRLPEWKTLPEVPKNIAINNEPHFVTYLMIQDPNTRTVLGALGVFVLSAAGLVGKNFVDGVKSIWVRKKEADVQRDLQEKLISVETRSFSGKMQILRNMLSEKAHELEDILQKNNTSLRTPVAFRKFLSFGENPSSEEKLHKSDKKLLATIAASALAITGLGVFAFKNVQKTAKLYANYEKDMLNKVKKLVQNSDLSHNDLEYIKKLFTSLRVSENYIKETLSGVKKAPGNVDMKKFAQETIQEVEKIYQRGAEAIAGSPGNKPSYYSHTNDDRAHLYNMIVNPENPLLKILFAGMTTVTALGYVGTKAVEAIREVQVIKENANTELELQNRLVEVELKNFETKKKSVIEPLMDEFRLQAFNGKDKKELKVRAENILYEIKNGPPFVYS